jgi:flagellar biosynthesis regulator FlaF
MAISRQAAQAYESASQFRTQRDREADIFRRVTATLKAARDAGTIARIRALADNRRLWITINDLMRDPTNMMPLQMRAQIVSVGMTVQRVIDQESPDFEFLISINENFAAGLSGQP